MAMVSSASGRTWAATISIASKNVGRVRIGSKIIVGSLSLVGAVGAHERRLAMGEEVDSMRD
jgi:hypothetical protein